MIESLCVAICKDLLPILSMEDVDNCKTTFALAIPFMFQFVEGSFALKQWKFLYAMRSDCPNCIQETEVLFALIIDFPLCI